MEFCFDNEYDWQVVREYLAKFFNFNPTSMGHPVYLKEFIEHLVIYLKTSYAQDVKKILSSKRVKYGSNKKPKKLIHFWEDICGYDCSNTTDTLVFQNSMFVPSQLFTCKFIGCCNGNFRLGFKWKNKVLTCFYYYKCLGKLNISHKYIEDICFDIPIDEIFQEAHVLLHGKQLFTRKFKTLREIYDCIKNVLIDNSIYDIKYSKKKFILKITGNEIDISM